MIQEINHYDDKYEIFVERLNREFKYYSQYQFREFNKINFIHYIVVLIVTKNAYNTAYLSYSQ